MPLQELSCGCILIGKQMVDGWVYFQDHIVVDLNWNSSTLNLTLQQLSIMNNDEYSEYLGTYRFKLISLDFCFRVSLPLIRF